MEATIFLVLLAVLLFFLRRLLLRNPKLAHLPGPKGLPILGTLLEKNPRLEFSCAKWTKSHGPVLRVPIFTQDLVILNSREAIYEALVQRGTDFAGRPQQRNFRSDFLCSCKGLAFADPTPAWHKLRKTSHSKLKQYEMGMARIETIQLSIISRLLNDFRTAKGKPFDPHLSVYKMTLNIMTLLMCGRIFNPEQTEFKLFERMERAACAVLDPAILLNLFPFLRFFGVKSYRDMVLFRESRHKLYTTMRAEIMADPEREETGGVLYALCKALEDVQKKGAEPDLPAEQRDLDELDVEVGFVGVIIAGVVTTTRFFYAYLNLIAQNPRVQAQLQEEVDRVVGPSTPVGLIHKQEMPYAVATMYELLRYFTITPFALPHCTLRDTSVGGHPVPKGTDVLINLWHLHHDDAFWDAPHEFHPERFLDSEGCILDKSHPNRQHLMPFGAGIRVCLGEQMGLSRLFLLVASVAQVFELKTGPKKVSCDPRDFSGTGVLDPLPFEIVALERNSQLYLQTENGVNHGKSSQSM